MRLRDITICSVSIFLAVALLITAGMQLDYINSQRKEMKLISNEPLENAPPSLAFVTVAMGAFRGLVVDVLWIRADNLKNEGQFFDAKQIAEWITTLQPRFASVWEFHAWNMAYNISVCLPASQPQERWRWVKNGYELLRDQGIPLNPKSLLLYRELARIFQHKIGYISDDAHKYYKLQLATAMEPLLGPGDNEYFKNLAEAPIDWQQIKSDASAAQLIKALKTAEKTFLNEEDFVSNYLSLRQNPGRFDPNAFSVIDDYRGTEALEKFDIFAKAYQLRKVWKLDPVFIQQLNQTYGPVEFDDPNTHQPLDWRHADSHAIYWAVKGLQQTADKKKFSVDEANTDRIVNHSLQSLFRNGKIFTYNISPKTKSSDSPFQSNEVPSDLEVKAKKEIFLRSDLRMFEPYNKSVMAVLEKYENVEGGNKGTFVSLQNGHKNMLKNAVFSFYQAGHISQAQKIYNQIRQLYPSDEVNVPLVVYAKNRLRKELTNIALTDAKEMIQMILREGYFRYAIRDDDEAFSREKMAKEIHTLYRTSYSDEDRINLPDFKMLRYFALQDFFYDNQYPLNLRRGLLGRIRVERPDLAGKLERQEKMLRQKSK